MDKSIFLLFLRLVRLFFGLFEHHAPTILEKASVPIPDLGKAAYLTEIPKSLYSEI